MKILKIRPIGRLFRKYSSVCNATLVPVEKDPHIPVMVDDVVKYLQTSSHQTILDMTFGAGGHSRRILESASNIKLIALDRDPVAYKYAQDLSIEYPNQVFPICGKFSQLPNLLEKLDIHHNSIDGILIDCGCSSMQFDTAERGFSVSKNGPLNMRMDGDTSKNQLTAADILAKATEDDIFRILKFYGEEKQARKISRTIVEARYLFKKLTTTEELADLVDSCFTSSHKLDKLNRPSHNATKTFQALRIFVNNELNELNYGLILAHHYLKVGGRLITLTFHSLEDTIVKRHLMGNLIENSANPLPLKFSSHMSNTEDSVMQSILEKNWKLLHKHVLKPSFEEVTENPRSRSAKFRAAEKIR